MTQGNGFSSLYPGKALLPRTRCKCATKAAVLALAKSVPLVACRTSDPGDNTLQHKLALQSSWRAYLATHNVDNYSCGSTRHMMRPLPLTSIAFQLHPVEFKNGRATLRPQDERAQLVRLHVVNRHAVNHGQNITCPYLVANTGRRAVGQDRLNDQASFLSY